MERGTHLSLPSNQPIVSTLSIQGHARNPYTLVNHEHHKALSKVRAAVCERRLAIITEFYRTPLPAQFHVIPEAICFGFCANYADQSHEKTFRLIESVRRLHLDLFTEFEQLAVGKEIIRLMNRTDQSLDNPPQNLLTHPHFIVANLLPLYLPGHADGFSSSLFHCSIFKIIWK